MPIFRPRTYAPLAVLLLCLALSACQKPLPPPVPVPVPETAESAESAERTKGLGPLADELLADYRRTIVLMQGVETLPPGERAAVTSVGQLLFHAMQQRQQWLLAKAAEPAASGELLVLLDRIENDPDWFDADRLAFKELLEDIATRNAASQSIGGLRLARRARDDLAVLGEIEQAYDRELKDVFGRLVQRSIERKREKWIDYVAKLQSLYRREQLLTEYGVPPMPAPPPPPEVSAQRGGASKIETREIFGASLPPKTVVLTFDDGPHASHTDEILEILKRYGAPATFFVLGQNLGQVDAAEHARLGPKAAVARRILEAGHQLADHSYSHAQMPRLAEAAVRREASGTETLLDAAGRSGPLLFRFPYGARNPSTLATIEGLKLRSMMWSVDSLDWADPVPRSIADRVLSELDKAQRGIVLFHDIQGRTVKALPLVLEQLAADGWRFAMWRGDAFVLAPVKPLAAAETALAAPSAALYRDSHALVIGIDRYAHWPGLHHATADARAIRQVLIERFGFRPDNVTTLLDGDATRAGILRAMQEKLADPARVRRDDRVLVFFAGHGSTRRLASGRDVGYIVPVDAPVGNLAADAISMPQLQEVAEGLAAKHALLIIDACYSGLGLTRGGAPASSRFLDDNARRTGRQMMTAGGADQAVADDGPGGHSVFTWTVLQALLGKGDLNGDGVMTGTELAAYVAPAVAAIARQTPAFGSLPGSEGGEFVFEVPAEREALSSDSPQMDASAGRLNQRIEVAQAQAEHRVKDDRIAQAGALEVLVKNLEGGDSRLLMPAPATPTPRVAAQQAHDKGLLFYRERRYAEAEAAFLEALKLQPRFALAANNLGFVHYRRGQPAEAARWFQQAIDLDGSRALTYLNLGDARLQTGDDRAALAAYTTFVSLAPGHPRTPALQAWIGAPAGAVRPQPPAAG